MGEINPVIQIAQILGGKDDDGGYGEWFKQLEKTRGKQGSDYDYKGWYTSVTPEERAKVLSDQITHFSDKYKMPTHPTFSDESIYSTAKTPGGHWAQDKQGHWSYTPSDYVLSQHPAEELQKLFSGDYGVERDEKGNITGRVKLILPKKK